MDQVSEIEVASPTAPTKRTSIEDSPELILLRHCDVRWVMSMIPKQVPQHLRDCEKSCKRAAQKYMASDYNKYLLGRYGWDQKDLTQAFRTWSVGYLRYYKPDPGQTNACDGRLWKYLGDRFGEAIVSIGKLVQDCTAEIPDHSTDDYRDASMSESSGAMGTDEPTQTSTTTRSSIAVGGPTTISTSSSFTIPANKQVHLLSRSPDGQFSRVIYQSTEGWIRTSHLAAEEGDKKGKFTLLMIVERLALHDHSVAAELVSALEYEIKDGRSQASRILQGLRACAGETGGTDSRVLPKPMGSGTCDSCRAFNREPDASIHALEPVQLVHVRQWLEQFLDVNSSFSRSKMNSAHHGKMARLLGLTASNSDKSASATRLAYLLLRTERGSKEEAETWTSIIENNPSVKKARGSNNVKEVRILASWTKQIQGALKMAKKPVAVVVPRPTKKLDQILQYPALKIEQNGRTFYLAAMKVDDIEPACFVDSQDAQPDSGYQRKLEVKRADSIAEFLGQAGNSIPGSIVVSATEEAKMSFADGVLTFTQKKAAFAVLDGQHRLWGYSKCDVRHVMPVVIYEGLDTAAEARLFLTINDEAKGVPRALLLSIKGIAGLENALEAELRQLFKQLSTDPASPIKDLLHIGAVKQGKISRSSFDYGISRAQRSVTWQSISPEKRYEVVLAYIRAVHTSVNDKTLLGRRYYFAAVWELFEEVMRQAKTKHGSCSAKAIGEVVGRIANAPGKFQREYVEAMRGKLCDTSIDDGDLQ